MFWFVLYVLVRFHFHSILKSFKFPSWSISELFSFQKFVALSCFCCCGYSALIYGGQIGFMVLLPFSYIFVTEYVVNFEESSIRYNEQGTFFCVWMKYHVNIWSIWFVISAPSLLFLVFVWMTCLFVVLKSLTISVWGSVCDLRI